jgi:hypothetical protein
MTKNILLILNTNFHFETVLSFYQTAILNGRNPTILLDYTFFNPSDKNLYDFNSEDFCKKYNLKYITKKNYENSSKNYFDKAVIISGSEFLHTIDVNKEIISDFNDKIVLIFHRADYSEEINFSKTIFKNPKYISVTKFSQKYNLPFIFQIENPITNNNVLSEFNKNEIEFLVLGRFCWPNRSLNYINEIISLDEELTKKIKISIVGQKPFDEEEIKTFSEKKLKNIQIEVQYNISEVNFYKKIINSNFILNLIDYQRGLYFLDRFSSNIHHTIAFNKPNLCFMPLNLIYNIPSIEYTPKNFKDKFLECIDINEEDYLKISDSFTEIKSNMRNHNNWVLNNLLN